MRREPKELRGEAKLRAALAAFEVSVEGCIAMDVGASAGGFTRVLLARGAARVYAVDVGHGQLLGSLRQNARVVNLEATNLGELDRFLVPDLIQVVTVDVSFLSLANAVPQLERVGLAEHVDLIALVKPMFELHLAQPPTSPDLLQEAVRVALDGIESAGWSIVSWIESPVRGSRGAVEFLIHARRGVS
jgi:23S rRNA (cytidine1920-2'-O)/16S rRNA (cytidine1409-2'-O)-methyltransferase